MGRWAAGGRDAAAKRPWRASETVPTCRSLRGTGSQSLHLLSQRIFPVAPHQKNLEKTRQNLGRRRRGSLSLGGGVQGQVPEGAQASPHIPPACPARRTSCRAPTVWAAWMWTGVGHLGLPSWGTLILAVSKQAAGPSLRLRDKGPHRRVVKSTTWA